VFISVFLFILIDQLPMRRSFPVFVEQDWFTVFLWPVFAR